MPRWALSRQATLVIAGATMVLLLVSIGARWQFSTAWVPQDDQPVPERVLRPCAGEQKGSQGRQDETSVQPLHFSTSIVWVSTNCAVESR